MTDISKCDGIGCIKKYTCYRFLAPDGIWQSYMKIEVNERGKSCPYYWKVNSKSELRRLNIQIKPEK